jgi:hypothetical protein
VIASLTVKSFTTFENKTEGLTTVIGLKNLSLPHTYENPLFINSKTFSFT